MYVRPNFKTKKELKSAVAAGNRIQVFSPGLFAAKKNGTVFIKGPYPSRLHFWFAYICVKNRLVIKVLG